MLSAELLAELAASFGDMKVDRQQQSRRAPRVHHSAKTTIYRLARKPLEAALQVQMRDVSARGCSFLVKEKLARDSNFIVRFSRKDAPPVSVLCTVMHCRAHGEQFNIGAEFTCLVDVKRAARLAEHSPDELKRIQDSILR